MYQLESKETCIDGVTYQVTQLPFNKGRPLLVRLSKSLGPSILEMFQNIPELGKKSLADIKVEVAAKAIAPALKTLFDNLNEEDLDYTVKTLAGYTTVETEPGKQVKLSDVIDFHFAGRYWQMFAWLGFCLKVNYASFLGEGGLAGLSHKVVAMVPDSPNS